MTKTEFKNHVTNRIAEGHRPGIFMNAANDILGVEESKAFLSNQQIAVNQQIVVKVGDNLERLVKQLGLYGEEGCGCQCFINTMNHWNQVGCIRNRKTIIDRLKKKLTFKGLLIAAYKSITTGFILKIGITSPIHNLVMIAICDD